ncbi:MAG: hypothetical protein U0452_09755 [Anaerolineae bacterium]
MYPRDTAYLGYPFGRRNRRTGRVMQIHYQTEVVMVLNTSSSDARGAFVTVDSFLHTAGSTMTVLYRSDWSDAELQNPPPNQSVTVQHETDGRGLCVSICRLRGW